jgi:hypothetical protein
MRSKTWAHRFLLLTHFNIIDLACSLCFAKDFIFEHEGKASHRISHAGFGRRSRV